jgi:putative tryptophan/tyrosine transport system substrate-binding protein
MSRRSEDGSEGMHRGVRIRKNVAVLAMVLVLLASAHPVGAQQARVHRIGFISPASPSAMAARDEAFRQGLRALGYVVGQSITIEYRWADGKNEQLPGFAAELVNLKLDVIVTHGGAATRAVQQATTTIPIVIAAADDPLAAGLVASLARPGGNITGLSIMTADLTEKRLELLKASLPGLTRVAVLWNAGNPISEPELSKAEAVARPLGLQLQSLSVRDHHELAKAFSSMKGERADALFLLPDAMFFGRRQEIVDLAASHRLPLVAHLREFADAGGLMSYGPNVVDLHRRAATYVDKILKGANPGDLPIEQPMKFDLVINLKTAQALSLTIPPSLLFQATEVIR